LNAYERIRRSLLLVRASTLQPRHKSSLPRRLTLLRGSQKGNARHTDLALALARLRNVVGRLHTHQRVHLHAKSFLDAERPIPGEVSLAIQQTTGDPIADRIRDAVEVSPNGLSRNQISRLFYGHVDSERIDTALEQLAAFGALAACSEQTSGRHSTRWLAVEPQQAGDTPTEDASLETDD